MKKNLLKSMLVALMVMVGGNAWAQTTYFSQDYEGDGATADWTTATNGRFTPAILEESGNHFLSVDQSTRNNNGTTITSTAAQGKVDANTPFTMTFDMRLSSSSNQTATQFTIYDAANSGTLFSLKETGTWATTWILNGVTSNTVTLPNSNKASGSNTIADVTWCSYKISYTESGITYLTIINKETEDVIFERAIVGGGNSTGGLGKMTFVTSRYLANFAIDNVVVREIQDGDVPVATPTTYTIKFVDESSNTIKEDAVINTVAGLEITAAADYLASIYANDKKYIYKSGNNAITTVEAGESNVITLVFREAAIWNYTVNATGEESAIIKEIAKGTAFEADAVTVPYPMYVNVEGTLWTKAATNKEYRTTVTLTQDNTVANLAYTATDIANVIYLSEGENIEGTTIFNGSNADIRSSNAAAGWSTKKINLTTLPVGKYNINGVIIANSGTPVISFAIGNREVLAITATNSNWTNGNAEFVNAKEKPITFVGGNSKSGLDFVYIQKLADPTEEELDAAKKADAAAAYGKIWEDGETTTDDNNNTIAEVDAAYFNEYAKAKDTVRVAVEVTSPSVPSAPARNIAKGSISAFAGPDNIFSKTGIELGADTIDIILTDDALAKIKEAESLKFVYTNLTLKSVELIEAVADSATLAEQAKLQNEITKAEGMLADENKTNGKDEFLTAINAAKALLTSIDIDAIKAGITALQTAEQTFIKANYYIDIAAGQYYIIDAETGKFMAAGHNYGTRGIVNTIGLDLTITPNTESRMVTIDTRIANGGNHFLGTNLYMDASVAEWALEYRGFGFWITNGTQYISIDEDDNLVMSDEPREWIIVNPEGVKATRMEELAEATKDAPKDATWAIQCANFNRNDQRISAWNVSEDCTNKNLSGGNDDNRCAESWHSTFTISQTLTGMPKGVYALTAQGFYRQDGDNTEATPVFFANEETGALPAKTGNEGSMNDASASFSAGNYTINPIYVEVGDDNTLKVGIKGTATSQWVIFDNFQLKYYGSEVSIDEIKNAAIYAEMLALREQLKNIKPEVEIQVIKDSIDNVLNSTENPEGAEAINNTIVSLRAVLEVAQSYVKVKTILPNMNQLTEETNFYTEEALNQYYTQWVAKYQNGTLTKDEADALKDPFLIAGWRSANTIDDLLMSVWDENPENWESYHVNNWSTEGGTDGSNFVVPFIEYWTGDANSLAPKTLTATINNLEEGNYEVSVLARIRVKNGANDPTGITMTVNDEVPTNVCAGTQVGETQFYMGEFTAVGDVYSDGVLKFKFNVLDGNNISWLAFKNAKYTRLGEVVGIAGVKSENKLDGTVYNLNGQKVEKAQRGLYIMNGKKVVVK